MKALSNWKNLDSKMQKQWSAPFSVKYMEDLKTLDQPMGNNECGFYVMWAMLKYFGAKTNKGDDMVYRHPISIVLSYVCASQYHLASITAQSKQSQPVARF
jgi:hypothetical protein